MIAPREKKAVLPQPIQLDKLLLVEGETPCHFFEAFAKHLGIQSQVEIRSFGGVKQLKPFLKTIALTAEFKAKVRSLGIVRDAENDAIAAKAAVDEAVREANLSPGPKVSVYILPNNSDAGMIETLFQTSVCQLPIFECVNAFFACVSQHGFRMPGGPIAAKFYTQVYMATCGNVQMMPGLASYDGTWPFAHDAFEPLRAFLSAL